MSHPEYEAQVRAALEKVWRVSRHEALSRLATLESFLHELRSGKTDERSLSSAQSAAHRLSGTLGMFGLKEGSACAAEVESLLCHESGPNIARMGKLVGRLRILMEEGPSPTRTWEKYGQ